MPSMRDLEVGLNRVENALSMAAGATLIFPLFGAIKVKMGVIQLVAAVVSGIFASLYARATGNQKALWYATKHVNHGVGNIIRGVIEMVPIVQTLVNFRLLSTRDIDDQENKEMRYDRSDAMLFTFNLSC